MNIEQLYKIYKSHPEVVIDSRKVTKGCLFFAIRGERFDGNVFAEKAIANGAAYAVIDNAEYKKSDQYVLVDDTLETLQILAKHHRRQFQIPLIGITGSNGKTTTKELIAGVLSQHFQTHFTKGNFNNHIGVPLTLLAMPETTEMAVIEMGANHQGEIDFLCKIAEPTHGLITNIGKAHLEGFGGIEGVKKGKSELYKFLENNDGIVFVNLDEPFLQELSSNVLKRVFYKKSEKIEYGLRVAETLLLVEQPFLKVAFYPWELLQEQDWTSEPAIAESHLIGEYNFNNIMTGIVIGRYFQVPTEGIVRAIENYVPKNNRSEILEKGSNKFILDAYNANPTSIKHALIHFSKMEAKSKIAILGSMLELGEYSDREHKEIAAFAEKLSLEQVVLVGKEFEEAAVELDLPHFEDTEQLKSWMNAKAFENTCILLKGSRGIGLEKVLG